MKKFNDYAGAFTPEFYERTPKAVFAALLASIYLNQEPFFKKHPDQNAMEEWEILHANGIVPQKPPAKGAIR